MSAKGRSCDEVSELLPVFERVGFVPFREEFEFFCEDDEWAVDLSEFFDTL